MYHWAQAQEYELWLQSNREFTRVERERAEAIDEWEEANPSFLNKIISVFRPGPAATEVEAEGDALALEEIRARVA